VQQRLQHVLLVVIFSSRQRSFQLYCFSVVEYRSSITRLSVDQKQILAQKNAEDERVHLHSVLGQFSEEVSSVVEADSESRPEKPDSESDDANEISVVSSSKDTVLHPASEKTNGSEFDVNEIFSKLLEKAFT
jgi:hypothetical protein